MYTEDCNFKVGDTLHVLETISLEISNGQITWNTGNPYMGIGDSLQVKKIDEKNPDILHLGLPCFREACYRTTRFELRDRIKEGSLRLEKKEGERDQSEPLVNPAWNWD